MYDYIYTYIASTAAHEIKGTREGKELGALDVIMNEIMKRLYIYIYMYVWMYIYIYIYK